jgi:hypothetical protein
MSKLAPTLQAMVDMLHPDTDQNWTDARKCKAELRALLAVAKAADRHTYSAGDDTDAMDCCPGLHTDLCLCRICKTVKRLKRVSEG